MRTSYVIQWKSKINGRAGRGTRLFRRDEAERLASELNAEYPGIIHEAITAPKEPPPGVEAERETETVITE